MRNILKRAREIHKEIVKHRRIIHKNPELSFDEYKTSAYIVEVLSNLDVKAKIIAKTGVVAHIGNGDKCLALRADIDALPINEETKLEFASENSGVMHACGHDMHIAMLLAAAQILKENEKQLNGTVKLIFQPGEEKIPGGAKLLISEGVLENPKPEVIFGQHVNPGETVGNISIASNYIMASADELYWTIRGKGGHAAQPHLSNDTIISASQLVVTLQTLLNKFKNPIESGVLSITAINGGTAPNVFPDEVKLMGTLRTFNNDWREFMHAKIDTISKQVCDLYNCECDFRIAKGYPPLFNNTECTDFIKKTAISLFGENSVLDFEPKMWAEDFSYFAQEIPSTFWFVGVRPKDIKEMPALHNAKMSPDEESLIYGTALFVEAAMKYLK